MQNEVKYSTHISCLSLRKFMDTTITISSEIAHHLNTLPFGSENSLDEKLRKLLEGEYRRRLTHFSLTDRQFQQKYAMDFEAFEENQVTKIHNYTWAVESDAMAWETAVDGMQTMRRMLNELGEAVEH
jgi:hypothetical protein